MMDGVFDCTACRGVNVRGWGHALIREMLLKRNGTLELEFARLQPRPPQPREGTGATGRSRPTGSSNGSSKSGSKSGSNSKGSSDGNSKSSSKSSKSKGGSEGGAPSSAAYGRDGPVGTAKRGEHAAALASKSAGAPAATTPRRADGEPERRDATPSYKQHQLYRKLNGKRAKSAYTAAAAAALAKLAGASGSSAATTTNTAKPFPIRKRRRRESATDEDKDKVRQHAM